MKGKWALLAAGLSMLLLAIIQSSFGAIVYIVVGGLYLFLAGQLFERYPRPVTTGRQLHFEISIAELHEMADVRGGVYNILQEIGFDMSRDVTWWDDIERSVRIFTQEIK